MPGKPRGPARIESLRVRNFRALHDLRLSHLTPLTVLLGPNGSGKSTVFDVFSFLAESFQWGLRSAWEQRGRATEMKTRGQEGPVVIELTYREAPKTRSLTYHLEVDERDGNVFVAQEWLGWTRSKTSTRPFRFLDYKLGQGGAFTGEAPAEDSQRMEIKLQSPEVLAVNILGQIAAHPRVVALREFVTDWYVSYLNIDETRSQPQAGAQKRLSRSGDNLANVILYLRQQQPAQLKQILDLLRNRVPRLEQIITDSTADGRLVLEVKDAPFDQPILARYVSDGTLKLLAYLVVLYDPDPPRLIGIEEPENFLHPRLLPGLAEECRRAAEQSQLFVTTHSPFFLNSMRPQEVRILYRDERGYTQALRAADSRAVLSFVEHGAALGDLWLEGHFAASPPI